MATLVNTHVNVLADGRRARVREYDDGSVRFLLDKAPYVIEEAFVGGRGEGKAHAPNGRLRPNLAIIKLSRRSA